MWVQYRKWLLWNRFLLKFLLNLFKKGCWLRFCRLPQGATIQSSWANWSCGWASDVPQALLTIRYPWITSESNGMRCIVSNGSSISSVLYSYRQFLRWPQMFCFSDSIQQLCQLSRYRGESIGQVQQRNYGSTPSEACLEAVHPYFEAPKTYRQVEGNPAHYQRVLLKSTANEVKSNFH